MGWGAVRIFTAGSGAEWAASRCLCLALDTWGLLIPGLTQGPLFAGIWHAVLANCCLVSCSRGRLPHRSLLTAGLGTVLSVAQGHGCNHMWLPAWRSHDLPVVWACLEAPSLLTA